MSDNLSILQIFGNINIWLSYRVFTIFKNNLFEKINICSRVVYRTRSFFKILICLLAKKIFFCLLKLKYTILLSTHLSLPSIFSNQILFFFSVLFLSVLLLSIYPLAWYFLVHMFFSFNVFILFSVISASVFVSWAFF